ncbi:MAG: hypothetical protein U1F56_02550 [Rubrivivax sp.]
MTLAQALADWLPAFALTQAVEAPIYRWGARASWARAFGASALTHPLVWFAAPALLEPAVGYTAMVAVAEAFAVGAEALWIGRGGVTRPLRWSLIANAASLAVGLALRALSSPG